MTTFYNNNKLLIQYLYLINPRLELAHFQFLRVITQIACKVYWFGF